MGDIPTGQFLVVSEGCEFQMNMRSKRLFGAVTAAGVLVAGGLGLPTASAAPGVADTGGVTVPAGFSTQTLVQCRLVRQRPA